MIALRFLLIGAALFVADSQARQWGLLGQPVLAVDTAAQVEDEVLYREALRRGLDRSASVRRRLVELMRALEDPSTRDDASRDDARYRQALALGLDRTDLAIRRHLVLQMRLLASLPRADMPITDADLADLLRRKPEQFAQPAQLHLAQVFFSKRSRGARARRDALANEGAGDPFPSGPAFTADAREVAGRFGDEVADRIAGLPEGEWSEPLESIYGWHRVKVLARVPPRLPTIDEARPRLLEALRHERAEARYAEYYPELRARYDVRIGATAR